MTPLSEWAAIWGIAASVITVGSVLGLLIRKWIQGLITDLNKVQKNTQQLTHNGGTHVADYARDARDYAMQARDIAQETKGRLAAVEANQKSQNSRMDRRLARVESAIKRQERRRGS